MKKHLPILAGIGCAVIFGMSYYFTLVAQNGVGTDTFKLLAIRFSLSAIILQLGRLTGVLKIRFKGKSIKKLLLATFFNPLCYYILEIWALHYSPSSQIGLITSISPVILTLLGALVFKEYPTGKQVFFVCLTVSGVLFTNISGFMSGSVHPIGLAMIVAILLCGCFSTLGIKGAMADFSTMEVVCFTTTTGAVVYSLISAIQHLQGGTLTTYFDGLLNPQFVVGILYLSIMSSIIAFSLNYYSVSKLPLAVASSFSAICTVVSIMAGILLLNEPFTAASAIGAVLIMLGVWLLNASTPGAQSEPKLLEAREGEPQGEIPNFYEEIPLTEAKPNEQPDATTAQDETETAEAE